MTQTVLSLTSGIAIAGSAAYLGTLMLSRKMVVVAGPLGHLALPGAALGLMYGFNISLSAFPFLVLGIVIIWLLQIRTKLQFEALTAIVFAGGVAMALLFLPMEKAEAVLMGDIASVGVSETAAAVVLGSGVFAIVNRLHAKIMLISIHEDVAAIEGVNVKLYNLIYLACIAVIVAPGVTRRWAGDLRARRDSFGRRKERQRDSWTVWSRGGSHRNSIGRYRNTCVRVNGPSCGSHGDSDERRGLSGYGTAGRVPLITASNRRELQRRDPPLPPRPA